MAFHPGGTTQSKLSEQTQAVKNGLAGVVYPICNDFYVIPVAVSCEKLNSK